MASPAYAVLQVCGTRLMLDWAAYKEKNWYYVVVRVGNGHMEFQQVGSATWRLEGPQPGLYI